MKAGWYRLTSAQAAALREAANVRRDPGLPRDPITKAHERHLNAAWDVLNGDPAADGDRVVVVLTVRQAEDLSHAAGNTTSDPDALEAVFSEKRRRLNCLAAHAKLDDAIRAAGGFQAPPARPDLARGTWVSFRTRRNGRRITVTGEVVSLNADATWARVREHDSPNAVAVRAIEVARLTKMQEDR